MPSLNKGKLEIKIDWNILLIIYYVGNRLLKFTKDPFESNI